MARDVQLDPSWKALLENEFEQTYMQQLGDFLRAEKAAGKIIFPPGPQMFNALNSTPFEKVKVVVLGQDPYHGPGQAHGLSFSVPPGVRIPPSLLNIYKEIERDLGLPVPNHGCLQSWAEQGVLLLNATLSVQQANAGSHQNKGWEQFTDRIVQLLSEQREGLVFLLWGSYAQKKGRVIDGQKHCVLKSVHPSPLSAHRGFLGCGHFSATNNYLLQRGQAAIDWSVPAL
ncbi:uracil-DNA glycosylase [Pseudoteredinibacter isoporae]|uniref:Uracil-DNA glycosylase n=1 Tax=Pseudoteredinibacter isoporae TaxID=570281 RepID=A0A7X0MZ22_9GAMM|nr:uracil-DNA glycosylase [Pseudoteredinibacter isoporae]MBB6523699.1 uracil-DNA glycosylase [Pseudoteredinibacter isoporae]NHO89202.1 uracil-DNA glycosylase [Pseudoteredinibacter isoporae]NIB22187.1 uracil-DNA glycosylase [Pseudoteredinibacter isoporae]